MIIQHMANKLEVKKNVKNAEMLIKLVLYIIVVLLRNQEYQNVLNENLRKLIVVEMKFG